jgi:hypothetical protein
MKTAEKTTTETKTLEFNIEKEVFVSFLNRFNELDDDLTRFFVVVTKNYAELRVNTADKTVVKYTKIPLNNIDLNENEKIVWGIYSVKKLLKFLNNLSDKIKISLHYSNVNVDEKNSNYSSIKKEFGKDINFVFYYVISDEKIKITQSGVSINQFNDFYLFSDKLRIAMDETGSLVEFKVNAREFKRLYDISKISGETKYNIRNDDKNFFCYNENIDYKMDISEYNFMGNIDSVILTEKLVFIDPGDVSVVATKHKMILKYEDGFLIFALSKSY